MGRTIAVVFASLGLLAGCPSDDGDGGEDTDTDASTGSGATMSSTTAMTVTASGSGTSSSTTDDTTTDATTGTSMPETTSTASETDTNETDTATGTGTGTDGGTDTGGEATYPPCDPLGMPQCPKPWAGCYIGSTITHNVCTMPCENAEEDCPAPNGGGAVPACGGPAMDQCVLDCAGDVVCPDGMECVAVDPGMTILRCMWPVE